MPRVTHNAASKTRRQTTRRNRASTLIRARYTRRTTGANRSLITSNALAIRSIKRAMPKPIMTDYQYTFASAPLFGGTVPPELFTTIENNELMSPTLWASVLRKDENVAVASKTRLLRMQANLRFSLGEASWCQMSTFIVTIRKDAANRVINQANLVLGDDYIYSGQSYQPRLNPLIFRVLYRRHVSLMAGTWQEEPFTQGNNVFTSNSQTTLAKGQVNVKLNIALRQPNGEPWRNMNQSQLPPHQRYFQLTFYRGEVLAVDSDPPRVDTDILYTAYNAG